MGRCVRGRPFDPRPSQTWVGPAFWGPGGGRLVDSGARAETRVAACRPPVRPAAARLRCTHDRLPPPAYRRLSVEERRSQLLDAALSLFAHRAPEEVSLDDVAEAAGVSRPLVYRYFPGGKQQLYEAALRSAADELRAVLRRTPRGPAPRAVSPVPSTATSPSSTSTTPASARCSRAAASWRRPGRPPSWTAYAGPQPSTS